jgi:hypothetical protein
MENGVKNGFAAICFHPLEKRSAKIFIHNASALPADREFVEFLLKEKGLR